MRWAEPRPPRGRDAVAGLMPGYDKESERTYDDRSATFMAILGAVLIDAAIIGLFVFITWLAQATS